MTSINPYLNFDGDCEQAFEFYRSVFGGDFESLSRFSEAPLGTFDGDADGDKIMHVTLPLGDGQAIMGSDRPSSLGAATFGDSVSLSIAPDDAGSGRTIFEALSEGGRVTMPYERQFWGADYGMCIDRFGIHWMVNYASEE